MNKSKAKNFKFVANVNSDWPILPKILDKPNRIVVGDKVYVQKIKTQVCPWKILLNWFENCPVCHLDYYWFLQIFSFSREMCPKDLIVDVNDWSTNPSVLFFIFASFEICVLYTTLYFQVQMNKELIRESLHSQFQWGVLSSSENFNGRVHFPNLLKHPMHL